MFEPFEQVKPGMRARRGSSLISRAPVGVRPQLRSTGITTDVSPSRGESSSSRTTPATPSDVLNKGTLAKELGMSYENLETILKRINNPMTVADEREVDDDGDEVMQEAQVVGENADVEDLDDEGSTCAECGTKGSFNWAAGEDGENKWVCEVCGDQAEVIPGKPQHEDSESDSENSEAKAPEAGGNRKLRERTNRKVVVDSSDGKTSGDDDDDDEDDGGDTIRVVGSKGTVGRDGDAGKFEPERPNSDKPICSNCETSDSCRWGSDKKGSKLCNACLLYEKNYGRPRPKELETNRRRHLKLDERKEVPLRGKLRSMSSVSTKKKSTIADRCVPCKWRGKKCDYGHPCFECVEQKKAWGDPNQWECYYDISFVRPAGPRPEEYASPFGIRRMAASEQPKAASERSLKKTLGSNKRNRPVTESNGNDDEPLMTASDRKRTRTTPASASKTTRPKPFNKHSPLVAPEKPKPLRPPRIVPKSTPKAKSPMPPSQITPSKNQQFASVKAIAEQLRADIKTLADLAKSFPGNEFVEKSASERMLHLGLNLKGDKLKEFLDIEERIEKTTLSEGMKQGMLRDNVDMCLKEGVWREGVV